MRFHARLNAESTRSWLPFAAIAKIGQFELFLWWENIAAFDLPTRQLKPTKVFSNMSKVKSILSLFWGIVGEVWGNAKNSEFGRLKGGQRITLCKSVGSQWEPRVLTFRRTKKIGKFIFLLSARA